MQIFKLKGLARFVRRERISDASLREAIERAERGNIDADLGGGLIKQRVARPGKGRSGGFRMMVAYRAEDRAFFLFGFAKNERDNINPQELEALRKIATLWLTADASQIGAGLEDGLLIEVEDGSDEKA